MTTATLPADRPHDPWRDSLGRFLPGNPGGPGNPRAREMAEIRQRFRASVPDYMFTMIVDRLVAKCVGGHLPAIKLFFEYYLGKPDTSIDADRLNHHELALAIEASRLCQAARNAGLEPPPPPEPGPPPEGRPEAEWRRPRGRRRAGGAPSPEDEMLDALKAAMAGGGERVSAPMPPMPDTRRPPAGASNGAASGNGAGGRH